jgi:hypothetical protein
MRQFGLNDLMILGGVGGARLGTRLLRRLVAL